MPSVPPLEDPAVVKKIVQTLKDLTAERLDIEKKVFDIGYLLKDHGGNFSILHEIIVGDPKATWTKAIRLSRDMASGDIAGRLTGE
ncbi:hypothetical protein H0H81_001797 [Sphagnurus paluster]|uniref:Uncharacterized protein n=1 Tax=Sphagnurus paluster TaxID=117069 RepID=A0A9P7K2P1_9AGAR|nr:hypothetical protein H0H81_001797 [Sphagnurus paluster]